MNPFSDLVAHHVYRGGPLPPLAGTGRAYDYILAGNGLFKRAISAHIEALIPVATLPVAGLPNLVDPVRVAVFPGRIPAYFLETVLADARGKAQAGKEQLYQFHVIQNRYLRLTLPAQRADGARIRYRLPARRDGLLCDLHSHGPLPAFYSDTDDRDEQGFQFYAVVGNVLDRPEIVLRLGMYGDFCPLPVTALFTGLGPFTQGDDDA